MIRLNYDNMLHILHDINIRYIQLFFQRCLNWPLANVHPGKGRFLAILLKLRYYFYIN